MSQTGALKKYSAKTWFRFIFWSLFGVFSFFINVPMPAYQITIGGWAWAWRACLALFWGFLGFLRKMNSNSEGMQVFGCFCPVFGLY